MKYRYQKGIVQVNYNRFLGYMKEEEGLSVLQFDIRLQDSLWFDKVWCSHIELSIEKIIIYNISFISVFLLIMSPREWAAYKMINEYIEEKCFKVYIAYIAEVKKDLGLPMYNAPNVVKELKQPEKHLMTEKVDVIKAVLKYFKLI